MEFDFGSLSAAEGCKLLVSFVGPRPIALVTTLSPEGVGNAAPSSFFNVFAQTPPLLTLGLQDRPDGEPEDTTRNIRATGEFVVNLVDEPLARRMVVCAVEFSPEVDEARMAGLGLRPSATVEPGRVAEAPVAFECRLERTVGYPGRCVVSGEVARMHVRDACIDPATLRVRPGNYHPVARMHGDRYVTAKEWYVLAKLSYEAWCARAAAGAVADGP
jgi:flavin reductase (DIM6/NTAB) family NADH-FMN oxidoreductase RutF